MNRDRSAFLALSAIASLTICCAGFAQDDKRLIATAYDPAQNEGASNQLIESVKTAVGRDDGEDSGNPLWAVPLTSLVETRDRPLFSPSRRPAPVAPPPAVSPPQVNEPVAVAPAPPEKPPWALVGTIIAPGASLAIVQAPGARSISRMRIGEGDAGWRVRSVAPRSIVVEKGQATVTLELPRVLGADAPSPP